MEGLAMASFARPSALTGRLFIRCDDVLGSVSLHIVGPVFVVVFVVLEPIRNLLIAALLSIEILWPVIVRLPTGILIPSVILLLLWQW